MNEPQVARELPKYKSHKEVWALKIAKIEPVDLDLALITPVEEGYAPFQVSMAYMLKHNPQPGGYYVRYKDGYESFSPAKQFEEGNTLIS